MALKFIDAGYEPNYGGVDVPMATEAKESPKIIYPSVHLDGKAFAEISNKVGEEVLFMINGKVTGIRKDKYGECIDVEVREVGTYDKESEKAVDTIVTGNEADKSLSKLQGSPE